MSWASELLKLLSIHQENLLVLDDWTVLTFPALIVTVQGKVRQGKARQGKMCLKKIKGVIIFPIIRLL